MACHDLPWPSMTFHGLRRSSLTRKAMRGVQELARVGRKTLATRLDVCHGGSVLTKYNQRDGKASTRWVMLRDTRIMWGNERTKKVESVLDLNDAIALQHGASSASFLKQVRHLPPSPTGLPAFAHNRPPSPKIARRSLTARPVGGLAHREPRSARTPTSCASRLCSSRARSTSRPTVTTSSSIGTWRSRRSSPTATSCCTRRSSSTRPRCAAASSS